MNKTNFLESIDKSENKKIKNRRPISQKIIFSLIIFFAILLFILIIISCLVGSKIYQFARLAKTQVDQGQQAIIKYDFSTATEKLNLANSNFSLAQKNFKFLTLWRLCPYFGQQIKAAGNLLVVGTNLTSALSTVSQLADDILTPITADKTINFNQITAEQKGDMLEKIVKAKPLLYDVRVELDLAYRAAEKIPERGLLKEIKKISQPIKDNSPVLKEIIDKYLPTVDALPLIVGYPAGKNYLFLLQNSNELRPTGGFFGTYGILKVQNAEILSLATDNIYNLDAPFEDRALTQAPWPIAKYAQPKNGGWFMRDSNWSPDFPTSAEKALWFYQQENGPEKDLHGVIAIDPTVIISLIKLTGNIKVQGIEFTPDNFTQKLQTEVEINYQYQGKSDEERKDIIGKMANILLERLLSLPSVKWGELWQTITRDITERHVLIYLRDQSAQKVIEAQAWSGRLLDYPDDYLMVVDANLASLKTDAVMSKKISYQVKEEDNEVIGLVNISYTNNGKFTNMTTRYRTYTRIYVPLGSELIAGQGAMDNDRSNKPGEYENGTELQKTYFGAFIAIEPGETKSLSFKYKLPETIKQMIKAKRYNLYWQKQPGTTGHEINIDLELGKKIKYVNYYEQSSQTTKTNHLNWNLILSEDRELLANLD